MTQQPRQLQTRELALLRLYSRCQLSMDVFTFYSKWSVTHRQIAVICRCSQPTVDRWFGSSRQTPSPIYLRRLAEIDFIWEYWEQIPAELRERLCPPPQPEGDASTSIVP